MAQATAIILAGGKSTRMGTDKALIRVKDDSMLEGAVRALAGGFNEIIVSANNRTCASAQVKIVADVIPGRGPMSGIHAALLASANDINFVVPCDMPFINVRLALYMVELASGFDVVVPRIGDYYEALFAVYMKNCLPLIEEYLISGRNKVSTLYSNSALRIRCVEESEIEKFGNAESLFFNVNTPVDLQRAKKIAGRKDNGSETSERTNIED